jgi:propionate CoA-transferase
MLKKIIPVEDAIAIVRDGDVLATTGYGGNGTPDQLFVALEKRFLETGGPRDLTLIFAGGQGDAKDKGLNHLGHTGLLKRTIGGHYGLMPKVAALVAANEIEAYNLPEGVITHLYRDIAAGKPGTLSKVGLATFVDPRQEGGKMNARTTEDLVQVLTLFGREYLYYRGMPIKIAFIRGTTADPNGNITTEKESLTLENLAMAIAAKNSHGYVICQVERIAAEGTLDARQVKIPGALVDCVVIAEPEHHMQTYGTQYNPAFSGEVRIPLQAIKPLPLDERKIIARRAAMELGANSVVNFGIGMPDCIPSVASEEKLHDLMTLTVDPGVIGGVPMGGLDFGAAVNWQAVIDHCSQFDFIDGGGLDAAFLGFAECDSGGSVNASRFGSRIAGCGGFINISQNAKKVVFVSNFASGGAESVVEEGRLRIVREGKHIKFVERLGQVTFSGPLAAEREQDVLYVTERCVFRLTPAGLELAEVAPGINVERDILARLPFAPIVRTPALMDAAIFLPAPMGLRERMLDVHIDDRLSYDPQTNTVFMNYAGMRVKDKRDVETIVAAVDRLLGPLGKRVNSIVNYDGFTIDDEAVADYMEAVRYVEQTYYIKVSRYTNSGFMRLKLGHELEKRRLSARVFETGREARREFDLGPGSSG